MIYKKKQGETPAFLCFALVFSPGGLTAPDMPLLFVGVQHLPYLQIKLAVALGQPLLQIFVDGGFGNAEMSGGTSDGGAGFYHVHS